VPDQPNDLNGRVGRLDETVERLTSEVTSLKLELATMISALRELQHQQSGSRRPGKPLPLPPPALPPVSRPSMTPAAIVVLMAAGLLSWQLIATPRADRAAAAPPPVIQAAAPSGNLERIETTLTPASPTEPPLTPLVRPTVYKGTLAVNADQPGATVFVNRQSVGTAPVRVPNLRAGAHLVWVERDGYRRWTRVITVPAERVTRVSASLEALVEPAVEP
jgi:PEGA domain